MRILLVDCDDETAVRALLVRVLAVLVPENHAYDHEQSNNPHDTTKENQQPAEVFS
ncbi:MAG: hypothetical protein HYX68_14900 [Planctomycetes bacterium]|nr:hypothetical protein [Planctomycetota bacterium]